MTDRLIIEVKEGIDTPVKLEQTSGYAYKVVYGLDIVEGLLFHEAIERLGDCVRHSRECAGYSVDSSVF